MYLTDSQMVAFVKKRPQQEQEVSVTKPSKLPSYWNMSQQNQYIQSGATVELVHREMRRK